MLISPAFGPVLIVSAGVVREERAADNLGRRVERIEDCKLGGEKAVVREADALRNLRIKARKRRSE
jgi:hypothetical protein